MVIDHSPRRLLGGLHDADAESLSDLLDSSRRLGRFWPAAGPGPVGSAPVALGVRVPVEARRVVAGMPEFGE
ncbi:hypothetical protein [Kitasatospora cheerisanensis]|uniref:Uncharacterized protein n=1 Tax=Kitasatospora cheerisanensis KCTC 2395 TaxID=1348663 RepID=A0A066YXZ2_9ACTN|nr:hypothetical protein [Kitasatospora cheerisanensis]KDN86418.1 hypothetical protein KCH_22350 [Kitasatospora cheerisanensis KCTC 2395]